MAVHWRSSNRLAIVAVTLCSFVDMLAYTIIIPFLPEVVQSYGGRDSDIGWLLACYSIGLLTMSPILAAVSDKMKGRKTPMLVGLVVLIASTLLFAFAKTFVVLALGRLLQGVSTGTVWTLGLALIADTHDSSNVGVAMGIIYGAYAAGQLAGPPIGAVLFTRISYQAPFIFCCILALINMAVMLLYVEIPVKKDQLNDIKDSKLTPETVLENGEHAASDAVETRLKSENEVVVVDGSRTIRKAPEKFWGILLLPSIAIIGVVTIVIGISTAAFESTLALHLRDKYAYDVERIGLVFMGIVIPSLFCTPLAGYAYDRLGFRTISGTGVLLCAIIAPFLSLDQGIVVFLVLLITFTVSITSIAMAPMMPAVCASVPNSAFARSYAIFNMAYSIGLLLGPVIGSLVYQTGVEVEAQLTVCAYEAKSEQYPLTSTKAMLPPMMA
ncbi:hypothetical protein BASA61_008282 [Batrachochytrium salamandrivorans]|nr:hypothetical protein BASA61_008282 [Batrachochytrium salamandrivorans]